MPTIQEVIARPEEIMALLPATRPSARYAHDAYADSYHRTAGSRYCQVVGNRSQTRADRGDDHYAFVSYQSDGDVVRSSSRR